MTQQGLDYYYLAVPASKKKLSKSAYRVDQSHAKYNWLSSRLGGLPSLPSSSSVKAYFDQHILPNLKCQKCNDFLFLVTQFSSPWCTTRGEVDDAHQISRVYYVYLCNNKKCYVPSIDCELKSEPSSFAFYLERTCIIQASAPADEVVASKVPQKDVMLGSIESLLDALCIPKVGDVPAVTAALEKRAVDKGVLLVDYPVSFPPVSVGFREMRVFEESALDSADGPNDVYDIEEADSEATDAEDLEHNEVVSDFKEFSEEYYDFEYELSKDPWQCIRFDPLHALLSCPLSPGSPHCQRCPESQLNYQFQLLPSFFQLIDTDAFSNDNDSPNVHAKDDLTALLQVSSMDWYTVLVSECPSCAPIPLTEPTQESLHFTFKQLACLVQRDIY